MAAEILIHNFFSSLCLPKPYPFHRWNPSLGTTDLHILRDGIFYSNFLTGCYHRPSYVVIAI